MKINHFPSLDNIVFRRAFFVEWFGLRTEGEAVLKYQKMQQQALNSIESIENGLNQCIFVTCKAVQCFLVLLNFQFQQLKVRHRKITKLNHSKIISLQKYFRSILFYNLSGSNF